MKPNEFPEAHAVEETITTFVPFSEVRSFFQSRGIFIATNSRRPFGEFGARLILDLKDYSELRTLAMGGQAARRIAGFTVSALPTEEETPDLYSDMADYYNLENKPIELARLTRISGTDQFGGELHYVKHSPGKYRLLSEEERDIDFVVERLDDTRWQVICFPEVNKDVEQLENLFKSVRRGAYVPQVAELRILPVEARIQFYDSLLMREYADWTFKDVIGITVREPEGGIPEEEKEIEEEVLRGIAQAILQGSDLRTNDFVKRCEQSGYYFTTMTVKFAHKKEPYEINLRVQFKLRPIMFEIALPSMYQRIEETLEPTAFPRQRQNEILREFWDAANEILAELTTEPS